MTGASSAGAPLSLVLALHMMRVHRFDYTNIPYPFIPAREHATKIAKTLPIKD